MIGASTSLIAHIGFPTHSFKSPMIYNPYFESAGIDAAVVPMSCKAEHFEAFLPAIFSLSNIRGALITMPHKVTTVGMLAEASPEVSIAGACNAVRLRPDGSLEGDVFDGEGFVRGMRGKGVEPQGQRALVVGCGGVGSAIVASLAAAGVSALSLYDARPESAIALMQRVNEHYPHIVLSTGSNDPADHDLVVNATPMGMEPGDPLPMDVSRISSDTFVGEVVMRQALTPFLQAAAERGCRYQIGTDMLFEMIPAYLEFFGFPTATAEVLRATAQLP